MIKELQIRNFKSLEAVDVRLGALNIFIGTNSSGKSNFLDALRVLQGVGYGFTISEILNGKPKTASTEIWEGIRGGSELAAFRPVESQSNSASREIEIVVQFELLKPEVLQFEYAIKFSSSQGKVISERLSRNGVFVYDSSGLDQSNPHQLSVKYYKGARGKPPSVQVEKSRPALHQLANDTICKEEDRKLFKRCIEALSDAQRIDPSPDILRQYSAAQEVERMGERGENFAALVKTIRSDEKDWQAYIAWLRELSPSDVDDVLILQGALKEPLFAIREGGKEFPAQVLSDGTLRFAAITAALFQRAMPTVLTIEEIEKGIHPSRLRLLVELLRSQTKRLGNQVIATTHSPDVLSWLSSEDLNTTFLAIRDSSKGASRIVALGSLPQFQEAIRENADVAELFSEGWMESVA